MKVSAKDGAELHCEVKGEGEAVLLIAGLGGNASFWSEQVARLGSSFRAVSYDQRGAGSSAMSRIRYSIEQMAEDAISVLDALGIERAHVVGHSTGGCIGQVLAIEHPHRLLSLVLSSTWTRADEYFTRLFEMRRRMLRESGPDAYVRCGTLFQYPAEWIAGNAAALQAAERTALATFPPADILESKIEAILRFDRTGSLPSIRVPTLVNAAADDLICPSYFSRALADAIPRSQLRILQKGGHFCPRTRPEEYFRNLNGFLVPSTASPTFS